MPQLAAQVLPVRLVPRRTQVWPAVILFYACLLPMEAKVDIGNLRLYAFRIVLFLLLPWVLHKLTSGRIRIGFVDIMMICASVWMALAMSMVHGFAEGMESGGAQAFDLFTAYMVGRCALRSPAAFRRFLKYAVPGLFLVGISMAIESLSHMLIVRPMFADVFGGYATESGALRPFARLGLFRAYGPFPHPILAGLQMASFLPLYLIGTRPSSVRLSGAAASLFGLFSISSASFMAYFINTALVMYHVLQKKVRRIGWKPILIAFLFLLVSIQTFSQNGMLSVISRYLTLDPGTASYRILIWSNAVDDVAANPWFGIGFNEWTRPHWMVHSSIDAHWLLLAVRFGLPETILLAAATLMSIVGLAMAASRAPRSARNLFAALAISISVMAIFMFTVTFWANSFVWFALILGGAGGLTRAQGRHWSIVTDQRMHSSDRAVSRPLRILDHS